jgi:aminodeoxyfutalosine deaminase
MPHLTLCARYVFPVAGPPIPDGAITIDAERIVAVGKRPCEGEVCDLGNVAILPGLVNAHAHLDFSDLTAPLGEPGISLPDWIRRTIDYRRNASRPTVSAAQRVALGLDESVRCGVTTIGEIAQPDWPGDEMFASPLSGIVFQELIAPTAARVPSALEMARSHLQKNSRELTAPGGLASDDRELLAPGYWTKAPRWQLGLCPHAPYTVHPDLLSTVLALSTDRQVPVAMHLAESREELELLRLGTGPLRVMLEEMGAWDGDLFQPGARPTDYLRRLAAAHRALVVHGNYLDDEEIAFLGANSARMATVYCPRSHNWFAHQPYPLEKMLAAGATVALGTDGRGSSPDLSLLAEMRFAARRHPAVGGERILQMGTILGARSLGWEDRIGSLAPGKQADLAIVALPNRDAADPYELLFDSKEPVVACYCRGKPIRRTNK